MNQLLKGIAASPGLAIAKAFVLKSEEYTPVQTTVGNPELEAERFMNAVNQARAELEQIRASTEEKLGAHEAQIFEGHLLILEDPDLIDVIVDRIKTESVNAEFALYEVSQSFIDMLNQMEDELLRGRAVDIQDVTGRVMNRLRGTDSGNLSQMTEPCIIIAEDLTPSDTAQLNLQAVQGFITEIGSRTSHSAIMARSLDIPAIVGAGAGIRNIQPGTMVVMDASEGVIVVDPGVDELAGYQEKKREYDRRKSVLAQWVNRTTASKDGKLVELAANIGKLEDVQKALDNGAEGIGLFRTEFLYMGRSQLPTEDEQFNSYKYVLEKMEGKPVVIRTLDIGGDKELPYMDLPKESNPFLGQRALRLCLDRPDLFRTQLRALLRASRYGNLKIMFPMIAVLDELLEAKRILQEEKQKLAAEGVELAERIEVGMMIEVPAAAISAHVFAKEVDFFSIGTNDLIQYTMAADRMNETVSYLYQPCHPSILLLIRMVIDAAKQEGKWVGMCGEMAGDETAIPLLLGMGLYEFSMSAGSILPARELIARLSQSEWSGLAEQALTMHGQQEIQAFVQNNKKGEQ
ncbi:phosphoenolpyruvate-protein phosphotransferase [Cohnella kolymensis]|uniref:Phosphoenolpyruvate-protein phosphotransferase n=1 Tax=Cohnella kolymensis TaxID=1590652 RepID=A0ABR5A2G6_9BACL|nr:phosphoenolpyruvate--protein phosphotransferase [Cohnella kolymensis]KIL35196.1 phosphoenolpyruvate-protein phosphotransferase [Cohnella kolymensis]KIL36556.1 phosphoenolpyruvate-protein phosphotransferase [Cohnella kolymensis]